jgi:hypothetical protein
MAAWRRFVPAAGKGSTTSGVNVNGEKSVAEVIASGRVLSVSFDKTFMPDSFKLFLTFVGRCTGGDEDSDVEQVGVTATTALSTGCNGSCKLSLLRRCNLL